MAQNAQLSLWHTLALNKGYFNLVPCIIPMFNLPHFLSEVICFPNMTNKKGKICVVRTASQSSTTPQQAQ